MFDELDVLLSQEVTDDAWYDDGYIIARDIMNDFNEQDWETLLFQVDKKSVEWQKKLIYAIDNQIIKEELVVIGKVMNNTCDDELFDMCIDALRSYDVSLIQQFVDTDKLVQILNDKKQSKSNLEIKLYDSFIAKVKRM